MPFDALAPRCGTNHFMEYGGEGIDFCLPHLRHHQLDQRNPTDVGHPQLRGCSNN